MWVLNFFLVAFFSFALLLNNAQADTANNKSIQTNSSDKFFITQDGELERLGAAARQHGWRVEQDNKGNLLLFPQTNAVKKPVTIEPLKNERDQKIDAADLDTLQNVIAERGWGTRRDDQGNLLLYPPDLANDKPSATPSNVETIEAKVPDAEKSTRGDLNLLEEMLRARGWSTSRSKSGNLLLYPANPEKQTQSPASKDQEKSLNVFVGNCEYGDIQLNMGDKVSLPVNRWAEARAIQAASKKWTMPIQNWKLAMNRFMIEFEEQLAPYL